MGALYCAEGRVSVTARGYWFTSGGAKGPFGYYPHLKDDEGLPIYPDTQVHGDLRMAADWLRNLGAVSNPRLVVELFGNEGADGQGSRCFPGDLELSEDSRKIWRGKTEAGQDRFEVKSRIRIDEATRTVKEHFLVDLELARLDDLVLEASLFIGPYVDEKKCMEAKGLLEDSAQLLSGFGAFRSRGYGRGGVKIDLRLREILVANADRPTSPSLLALTARTNLRHKSVDPGRAQVIDTEGAITPAQVKAWLSRTYNKLFEAWPTPAEIASISMSTLYPSPAPQVLALPLPMTVLRNEKGDIKDVHGQPPPREGSPEANERTENFFSTKTKPLGEGWTATHEKKVLKTQPRRRVRNKTGSNFATTEDGLFMQEYLPRGTVFTGTLDLSHAPGDFACRAWAILTQVPLVLKGAWLQSSSHDLAVLDAGVPRLLTDAAPFLADQRDPANVIRIESSRTYNTTLERPRRQRIVVAPGSVIGVATKTERTQASVPWRGFGEPLCDLTPAPARRASFTMRARPSVTISRAQRDIARAQVGQIRELLHPALTDSKIQAVLDDRIAKFGKKGKPYEAITSLLKEIRSQSDMRNHIENLLDAYALVWREQRKAKGRKR